MRLRFDRPLVLLLLLTAIAFPLRWGHSHEGLQGQQLAQHIRLYHPPLQNMPLPADWHAHPLVPGLVLPEYDQAYFLNEVPESRVLYSAVKPLPGPETVDLGITDTSAMTLFQRIPDKPRLYHSASMPFYLSLQSMLI